MPGIVGIISRQKPSAECSRLVTAMLASMKHERFYEAGTCLAPEMGVYGGWVAHKSSYAARQSAESACGGDEGVGVAFAGECFMPAVGADDDVSALYLRSGDRFVAELNGLFSGLLIDRRRKRALLFNDRYGVERLYVHETDEAVYFASEAKALLCILPELRAFDDEGVAQYLTFGCPVGWRTLFRGIRVIEGGSLWSFQDGKCDKQRYFRESEWERQPSLSSEAFAAEFQATFKKLLPRYTGSDFGISLTGGLDTRMIMACLPQQATKPVCYTFSGLNEQTLDERLAARVATSCGLEHHVLRIEPEFLTNYRSHLDRTVHVTDACSGAMGAHEIDLNARGRRLAPVRLTGNFGSEVLRSMSTFKPVGLDRHMFDEHFLHLVDATAGTSMVDVKHPVTFAAFREIPWNLFGNLAAGKSQVTFRTPYLDNDLVALAYRAPVSSRQSPLSALQLVNDNNRGLGKIPTDRGLLAERRGPAYAMARLFSEATFKLDYMYNEGMPGRLSALDPVVRQLSQVRLLGLHKYLPYRAWFRRELASCVTETLTDPGASRLPYWNRGSLASIAKDHISGRKNYVREINAVLTLEAANRLLLRG